MRRLWHPVARAKDAGLVRDAPAGSWATMPGLVPRTAVRAVPATPTVIFGDLRRGVGPGGMASAGPLPRPRGTSAWIYAAVHRKAADQAAIPLRYRWRRDGALEDLPDTHPLPALLQSVNEVMTFYDLIELNAMAFREGA